MSIDSSPQKDSGQIVIDGISYIPSSALLTGIPKISFKEIGLLPLWIPKVKHPDFIPMGRSWVFITTTLDI